MISAPTNNGNEPTTDDNGKKTTSVGLEIYGIDYTLSQTDRLPTKNDYLQLHKVAESYFKDYMVNAYQVSTQATLVDFTTSLDPINFTYVNL